MALDLNEQEITALEGGGFIDSTSIIKLLNHYNPNPEVNVINTRSNESELIAALEELKNDRERNIHLLPLHVNVLDRNFQAGSNNHFVGLMITRNLESNNYEARYIDPMGRAIHLDIGNILRNNLDVNDITNDNRRLQYANIEIVGDAEVVNGNNNDCGPMLIHLLTAASHGLDLPISQNEEQSRAIGVSLRERFINANGRDLEPANNIRSWQEDWHLNSTAAISNNFSSASSKKLGYLDISSQQPPLRRARFSNITSSAIIANSMTEDIFKRRLVSLARMFQGTDVCGAVYYDQQQNEIKIATNQRDQDFHDTTKIMFGYLSIIAQKSMEFSDIRSHSKEGIEKFKDSLEKESDILQKSLIKISEAHQNHGGGSPYYHSNKIYRKNIDRSIAKVTSSVVASYLIPKNKRAFPREFSEIFRSPSPAKVNGYDVGGNIEQINTSDELNVIHAEMKILSRLFEANELPSQNNKKFFIGVSKRCCLNCESAIKAVNDVLTDKDIPAKASSDHEVPVAFSDIASRNDSIQTIDEGHLGLYPSGIPPFFIMKNNPLAERMRLRFIDISNELRQSRQYPSIRKTNNSINDIKCAFSKDGMTKPNPLKPEHDTSSSSPSPYINNDSKKYQTSNRSNKGEFDYSIMFRSVDSWARQNQPITSVVLKRKSELEPHSSLVEEVLKAGQELNSSGVSEMEAKIKLLYDRAL